MMSSLRSRRSCVRTLGEATEGAGNSRPRGVSGSLREAVDVLVAGLALVCLSPLLLAVALLVLVSSDGPALYRARRVGRYGQTFDVLKFRTMRVERKGGGPAITRSGDVRITKVGRVLRRTKLDELPQLLNVVRGEMVLVGPRPEDPKYVARYSPDQRMILRAKPGITSAASAKYRHEELLLARDDWEEFYERVILPDKLRIDLDYMARQTLWSDVRVLLGTARSLFSSRPSPRPSGDSRSREGVGTL
jgi:lipopolysaccharide/colanic/teichoic acid biosynthesis glycosyltransferase